MKNPLAHASPDCKGKFQEIKSYVRTNGKRQTSWHYTCSTCNVTVLRETEGATAAYWEQEMFTTRMQTAAEEALQEKQAVRAFSQALRTRLPQISAEQADEAADSCLEALRPVFLKIVQDTRAKEAWKTRWHLLVQPAREAMIRRIEEVLPEIHGRSHPQGRYPDVETLIEEAHDRVRLRYHAPAGTDRERLHTLHEELPNTLPEIPNITVVPEVWIQKTG